MSAHKYDHSFKILKNKRDQNDTDVWLAFKNGSTTAFKFIYDNYADILHNYGRKLTPQVEIVEDCIHDLFIDLWKSRKSLAASVNLKSYLLASFRRKLIIALKQQKLSTEFKVSDHQFIITENKNKDDKKPEKLTKILAKIPKRQSEVIFLRFYNGLSCKEIAHVLNINDQSVYNIMHRAIKHLKKNLTNLRA